MASLAGSSIAVAAGTGRRSVMTGLAAACVAPILGAGGRAQGTDVVVETASGKVRGIAAEGVQLFRGIPYAESTAGANRFMPPRPRRPWAGIRDALAFGAPAPQTPVAVTPLTDWYYDPAPASEDCLSLNLFTPEAGSAARRPVMVWLHGGNWAFSAASAPGFDGGNLARFGDVVVVTVNHRLNLFGHLMLADNDERFADAGNAGVLDMIAALRWVRENAAAFGGDPGNVTIFGQSGGGAKVTALMAVPAANGLFHRVIAQSCSGSLRIAGQEEAAAMAHALARQLGLARATGAALQAVPLERLAAALAASPRPYRPVLDGRSFTRHPFDPDAPPLSAGIPLMLGNAAAETRLAMAADRRNFSLEPDEARRRIERFLRSDGVETDRIIDAYRSAEPEASASDLLAAITTDFMYRRNTTRHAALQAAAGQAPVYAYVFDWKAPVFEGLLRAPHTVEVPFVFGTARAAAGLVGTGPDIEPLTRMTIATWSAFARTGDPNNPTIPHWPRYEAQRRSTMSLDVACQVRSDPGARARAALSGLPHFEYSMPITYARP